MAHKRVVARYYFKRRKVIVELLETNNHTFVRRYVEWDREYKSLWAKFFVRKCDEASLAGLRPLKLVYSV